MVWTAQVKWTGTDAKVTVDAMKTTKKGTHKSDMWQHNTLPLVFTAWANNTIVKLLCNFHSPIVIQDGVKHQRKIDGLQQRNPVGVPVPRQQKDYSETFHKKDKGNGAKDKYDLPEWKYGSIIRLISIGLCYYTTSSSLI